MVQDQLVEYISSQLKLGVSRDAVKSALTGVGWAPLDVEDTLKKAEGGTASAPAQPAAAQKPMDVSAGPKLVSFSMPGTAAGQMNGPAPQSIKVSDLVSAVAPAATMPAGGSVKTVSAGTPMGKPMTAGKDPVFKTPAGIMSVSGMQKKSSFGLWGIIAIVAIVLFVGTGAFAATLFMKNGSLTSQLQAAAGQSQAVTQTSAAQVQALSASTTAFEAQIASLTSEDQNLATNLSLFAAPVGLSSTTASELISISGTLSAGAAKNTYVITTQYGVKASIKNSSDSGVAAALQPLLGTTVQIAGMYVPGTPSITVTSVNSIPITAAPAPGPSPAPAAK